MSMIFADLSTQKYSKKGLINHSIKIAISAIFSILVVCLLCFPEDSTAADPYQSLIFKSTVQENNENFPYLLAANSLRQNPKRLKRKKGKNTHKKYQQSINKKFPEWRSKEEKKNLFKQTSKYVDHLKRNTVLTEGILSHEGGRNGGETVKNHVSVSEKSLISRIEHDLRQKAKSKDKKNEYKELSLESFSSFKSIREADRLIDTVLADKNNQHILKNWVKENSKLNKDGLNKKIVEPNISRSSHDSVKNKAGVKNIGAKKLKLPRIDGTGKLHGDLLHIKDLKKLDIDTLRELRDDLTNSLKRRKQVTKDLGPDPGHARREGAEAALLKSLNKHLGD